MTSEVLHFQTTRWNGADAVFVTILIPALQHGVGLRESHVFVSGSSNVHLHEIEPVPESPRDSARPVASAVDATHALLHRHLAKAHKGDREALRLTYRAYDADATSLWCLALSGRFGTAFGAIRDWSLSDTLRSELARLAAYKTDDHEARELARLFA